jgi:phosphohistidine phosphatase
MRLYLLRHAKSSRITPGSTDFDRPLSEEGRMEMERMAQVMVRSGYQPGRITCSTAQRARETLAPLLPRLRAEMDICLTRRIYEADAAALLAEVRMRAGDAESLMLIGHNPAMAELARLLVAEEERLDGSFPTAALAVIELRSASWGEVQPSQGRLAAFHTPAELLA